MTTDGVDVIGGVDTHGQTDQAAAISEANGKLLGDKQFGVLTSAGRTWAGLDTSHQGRKLGDRPRRGEGLPGTDPPIWTVSTARSGPLIPETAGGPSRPE